MVQHALIVACVFTSSFALAGVQLARDGKSAYVIVVADDAIPPEKHAAKELAEHLKLITGAHLPIVAESDLAGGEAPQILIGQTKLTRQALPDIKWDNLGHDGIVLKTAGDRLILAGGRPRGAIYAVNTFLEDVVGVRWWTGDESTIPHKPTLDIPDLSTTYVPKLAYRETYNEDAINDHALFATRLKVNGHMTRIPDSLGGHYTLIGWCHTSFDLIPPGKYFADHPNWFAQINGKRQGGTQLCLSNPEMKQELIRRAMNKVRKNPDAGIISISQNDCGGPCECDQCKAIVKEEGSQAGPWIRLCNEAGAEINQQYPGFLVETLAYQYTRHPTKVTHPSKNVIVRLCSIEADFAHPLSGPSNKSFGDDLRGWSAIAPNLFIWNYVTSFSNYLIPHPNLTALGEDLRFFASNHVIGVFEQGDAFNVRAGDMLPLRAWLLAHLMWDPSRDQTQLRDEFCNGYFGAAGPMMIQYLDLINAPAKNPEFHIGCYNGDTGFITEEMLAKAQSLFDDAAKAVAGDADLLRRVNQQRVAIDHVKLMRYDFAADAQKHPGNPAAVRDDYRAAAGEWIASAKSLGVKSLSEGQGFASYTPTLLARGDQFIPVKLPPAGAKLAPGEYDIQDDRFTLFRPPQFAQLVDDPKASDHRAAKMSGSHGEWAVQFHIPANAPFAGKGPWNCYLVVRADVKQKSGNAFQYGLYHNGEAARDRPSATLAADGEYHTYCIPVDSLAAGSYFWVAPPGSGAVEAVYVDRIFIQKQGTK